MATIYKIEIEIDFGLTTCSKHNYSGTSMICPDCRKEKNDYWKRRCEAAERLINRIPNKVIYDDSSILDLFNEYIAIVREQDK